MRRMNSWVCGNDRMYLATRGSTARKRPEFRHEVRIGKKANVEHQIGLFRYAVAEAEAHAGNQDAFLRRLLAEALRDVRAQLVHVEF
jgi:hypothetical protein